MWKRILIAQPGEVAARVARTCKRLGITAIAAVSEANAQGAHAEACDEVITVSARPDGSIDPAEIVRVFREAQADAVYPGYGMGPREAELARALEAADLPFIGADADAVEIAADRLALRSAADRAFVRFVPGPNTPAASLADAIAAADELRYPVLVRPVWGPSGFAPVTFADEDELMKGFDALAAATSVCVEKAFVRPRLLDVLVAADMHGEVLGLAEQESTLSSDGCSLIEESPSPELHMRGDGESIRLGMFDTAIRLVCELRSPGLFTVRFIFDSDARVWVEDVLLGLPLQHGLCEMVTGLDLIGVQLAIAAGEPMPDEIHVVQTSGHAVAAVVGLARPDEPSTAIADIRFPPAPHRQVRFEPAVVDGQVPSGESARVLCKVTTYAPIRHQALLTLDRMLAELEIPPLETNKATLRAILAHESFRAGQYDVEFLRSL